MSRLFLLIFLAFSLSGCWNGGNTHVSLHGFSVGRQLIDLQAALETGAINEEEFEKAKQELLALSTLCEATRPDEG